MHPLGTALAVAIALLSAQASAQTYTCRFGNQHSCGPDSCRTSFGESRTHIELDFAQSRYSRCGGPSPCDSYIMSVTRSGVWLNLDFSTGVQGAKLLNDATVFIETVSIGDGVLVSYGKCVSP
jgi:hypothetical protein